jgi:hypothetical protein
MVLNAILASSVLAVCSIDGANTGGLSRPGHVGTE